MIQNKVNHKCYIGQTTRNPMTRLYEHMSKKGSILHRAFCKYGKDQFDLSILHNVPDNKLDEYEILEILERNTIKPKGYNLEYGGNIYKNVSDATREKQSISKTGNNNPRCRKIEQYTSDRVFINTYDCIVQAATELGTTKQNITECLKGRSKTAGGFIWKYSKKTEEQCSALPETVKQPLMKSASGVY